MEQFNAIELAGLLAYAASVEQPDITLTTPPGATPVQAKLIITTGKIQHLVTVVTLPNHIQVQ